MKSGSTLRRTAVRAAAAVSLILALPFAAACGKTSAVPPVSAYVPKNAGIALYVNTDAVMAHELFAAVRAVPPFAAFEKQMEAENFTTDDLKGKIMFSVVETFEPDGTVGRPDFRIVFQTAAPHAEALLRRLNAFLVRQYADDKTTVSGETVAGKPALSIRERGQECLIAAAAPDQLLLCSLRGGKRALPEPVADAEKDSFVAAAANSSCLAAVRLDSHFAGLYAASLFDSRRGGFASALREMKKFLATLNADGESLALSIRMDFAGAEAAQRAEAGIRLLTDSLKKDPALKDTAETVSIVRRDNTLAVDGKIGVVRLREQLNRMVPPVKGQKTAEPVNGDF